MKTVFIWIVAAFAALWLFCLVNVVFGVLRLTRRMEERDALPPGSTGESLKTGWRFMLGGSFLMMINIIGVLLGSIWYGLRGKPFPPAPGDRGPGESRHRTGR